MSVDLKAVLEQYEEASKAYRAALAVMVEHGQKIVVAKLDPIFAANPTLESVRWEQYTPYFNDGDPCVFGVREAGSHFEDTEEEDGDRENGYLSSWDFYDDKENPQKAVCEEVAEAISSFDDAFMLRAFDDHVEVTISRDGTVTVDEYSHD